MTVIGFIGTGNMGGALAKAAFRSHEADTILLANRTREKAEKLAAEINSTVCDNRTVASQSHYIFLGVKPQMLTDVYNEISEALKQREDRYVIVSMLAGKSLDTLKSLFGNVPIIRVAPNMPAIVGSGLTLFTANKLVTPLEKDYFTKLMAPSGTVEETDEGTLVTSDGVKGCGPAFAAMFVEGLADGAVACGLPRAKAIKYAAEMMKGTAEMLLETGMHPGQLKDSVCSPGGSTIQGVRKLEENGFRAALIDAVIATFEKKF